MRLSEKIPGSASDLLARERHENTRILSPLDVAVLYEGDK